MLTNIPAPRETQKLTQRAFGGLDLRPGARSGVTQNGLALVVRGMENMSGDFAPLLTTRRARYTAAALAKPNGLTAYEGKPVWADGTALCIDGESVGSVSDSPKVFATLGRRLLIWPDKKLWDGETLSALEASVTASGLVFGDGTYAQEQAKANSITTSGAPFPFRAGDAVTITGCAVEPANNKTPVVREISDDGRTLRFYENTFTLPEGESSVTEPGAVTLARAVPDLDFLCVNENRVWAAGATRSSAPSSAIRTTGTSTTASRRIRGASRAARRAASPAAAPSWATRSSSRRTASSRSTAAAPRTSS